MVRRQDVPDDDYPPGYVVGQTPSAGTRVKGGTTVVLQVANGEAASASVPDVLGLGEDQAVRLIERAGFDADVVREQEPPAPGSDSRKGLVWKQAPAGGTRRSTGSPVTIWVNPSSPDAA